MKVIFAPVRLKIAGALLLMAVPIAAVETILVTRAPWWRLPQRSILIWSASALFLSLPLMVWVIQGRKWAVRACAVFFAVWISLNFVVSYRIHSGALGFFNLALCAFAAGMLSLIAREMNRSFFDAGVRWFQRTPAPMPRVRCRLTSEDAQFDCRVGKLDREGAFVFLREPATAPLSLRAVLSAGRRSELTFSIAGEAGSEVRCSALPRTSIEGGIGAGFQFEGLPADTRKKLGDFIERLRGEGYGS